MTDDGRGPVARAAAAARFRARRLRRHYDNRRPRSRRLRVIGVGMGKSGTTSLAETFRRPYWSRHEAATEHREVSERALAGSVDPEDVRAMLEERDRLVVDVDSNTFLNVFGREMVDLWPDARFVLTIRDCFSWLGSLAQQHSLTKSESDFWQRWYDARYAVLPNDATPADAPAIEAGWRPVRSLLRAWGQANQQVLASIPAERLLVVRTDEFSASSARLAEFAGADANLVRATHSHKSIKRQSLAAGVDPEHVVRVADDECGPLMEQLWGAGWRDLITGFERRAMPPDAPRAGV